MSSEVSVRYSPTMHVPLGHLLLVIIDAWPSAHGGTRETLHIEMIRRQLQQPDSLSQVDGLSLTVDG